MLIDREAPLLEVKFDSDESSKKVEAIYKSFTALLDRSKLLVPSSTAIYMTMRLGQIWRCLVSKTSRRKLLECIWPRRVFVEVAKTVEREGNELVGVLS